MVDIRPLTQLNPADLRRLVVGYTSDSKYAVAKIETEGHVAFALELTALPRPYHKHYEIEADAPDRYQRVVQQGFSFGAFDGDVCVGLAVAEPQTWNLSLMVWELHVDLAYRQQGIGRRLVEALADKARAAGLRALVCETQNTNVPAMRFYYRMGFTVEGLDLSYYTNSDFPDGEIAVFMKKRL